MYRPDSSLAASGIKVDLAGHEHRRLQDVAATSVVLETAIIKVHRRGQGLKIESNCKKNQQDDRGGMSSVASANTSSRFLLSKSA